MKTGSNYSQFVSPREKSIIPTMMSPRTTEGAQLLGSTTVNSNENSSQAKINIDALRNIGGRNPSGRRINIPNGTPKIFPGMK